MAASNLGLLAGLEVVDDGTSTAGAIPVYKADGSLPELVENLTIGGSTAAAGSTTTDAGVLPAATAAVYLTTAADGTKGVRINAADAVTGRMIVVANGVAAVLKIYPPTGGTIGAASADAAFSTVSGHGAMLVCTNGATAAFAVLG